MDSEHQETVISGITGKFPDCRTVEELKDKLLSKSFLITPDEARKLPQFEATNKLVSGRIPGWNKFDKAFFGITQSLLRIADPMMGMMLEASFEAILDAGVNPYSLRGHNILVIASPSMSDSEAHRCTEGVFIESLGMVGLSRAMLANRISYCFSFTGPSYSALGNWSSAMQSLEVAVKMVSSGTVEAAIVTTANNMQYPAVDLQYQSLDLISDDGVSRPFDAEATGFVRSEAVVSFFIQRLKDAKRNYGTVLRTQTKFMGGKECSFVQLDPQLETFFKGFYSSINEKPEDVSYIEAHGTCHKEFDERELNALASVFCPNKKTPQLIGSISGNLGNTESCTGLVSVVKAIMAMETGVIPPTNNYHTPNPNVPALISGKLKPVTEETELPGDLVAVNTINFTGEFSHVLLRRNGKVKKTPKFQTLTENQIPRLVLLQARNEEGAKSICEKVKSMPLNIEFISMVNDVFKTPIPPYLWRGYTVIPAPEDTTTEKIKEYNSTSRPLWFVFSGMGSQWTGMGRELLKIPVFASAIEKCDKLLRPKGLDIVQILSSDDGYTFENILHCFVGITAVQIGLVDILRQLNITPDGIIGHSVGELGCAYADGCFSAEETILAAYARGKASVESLDDDYIKGMMAAIGLGYNDIKDKLPPSIDIACHNSESSCTVSGPTDDVIKYVEQLKSDKVFAKAVSAGGIAYHSRYIKAIAPKLLKYLKETVRDPKPRSSKWISTSVPESKWNTEEARLCSAEYHTNNLLNPVYFEEGCKHLPENALVLEIAPHGLLQAILRRSVTSSPLSLTNRTAESNLYHLFKCVGELYLNNVELDVNSLYPPVEYPVSRGTPSLVSLATWDHEEDHYFELLSIIALHCPRGRLEKVVSIHTTAPEYQLWKDHCISGLVVLPLAQILMYSWDMGTFSRYQKIEQYTIIEDVALRGHIIVNEVGSEIYITFSPTSLKFEVSRLDGKYMGPKIPLLLGKLVDSPANPPPIELPEPVESLSDMEESTEGEIYTLFSELGCNLGPQFQVIKRLFMGKKECIAKVKWNGNLMTFIDSLIKIVVIFKSQKKRILLHPNSFQKLTVDVPFLMNIPLETELQVHYQSWSNRVVCQGAELLGMSLSPAMITGPSPLVWSELKLKPYFDNTVTLEEFLSSSIQIAAEDGFNTWRNSPCTLNVLIIRADNESSSQFTQMFKSNFMSRSNIELKILHVDLERGKEQVSLLGHQKGVLLVAGENSALASLVKHCVNKLYCITYLANNGTPKYDQTLKPILLHRTESGKLTLLKKVTSQGKVPVYEMRSSKWLVDLKSFVEVEKGDHPIIVVVHDLGPTQVLSTLSNEPYAHRIRTFFIQDRDAPQFSQSSSFYSSQLSLGLSVNILSGGKWGNLRTEALEVSPCNFNLDNLVTSSNQNLTINCVGLNTTTFTCHWEAPTEEPELKYVDYSGMQKGQRVMGVAYFESNSIRPDSILKWPVPEDWTMEDAVTVPVLYTLAYYCIHLKGKVQKGEHVLVHAGMSPLGQAIISVALQAGAKVVASVMDEEEALILTEQLPKLKSSQVFVLDKEDIAVAVKKRTQGNGVDVIVNFLTGRDFQSTIKTTKNDCRTLYLAEIKIEDREIIGLYNFFGNKSTYGINLNNIETCSDEWKLELRKALKNGISQGVVKPLRKKLFRLRELTGAIRNLQTKNAIEKTVLVSKYEDQILPLNGYFQCNFDHMHVIAGENGDLKYDLAEWLIHHGARKLIVLNDEIGQGSKYMKRLNRMLYRNKCSAVISPSSRLDTTESALQLLKEILHMGTVSSIFCVSMDENSSKMKNLDSASRQLLPRLQQFVSLLGNGTEVCGSRARSGLPACSIRTETSLKGSVRILPYLFSLLADTQTKTQFFFVSENFNTSGIQVDMDSLSFLPNSVEDLHSLGECVDTHPPSFTEEMTLSPRYAEVKHNLLPVFVVPGLGKYSLKPLIKQLMHPAFCCTLPADVYSIEQLAEWLVKDILMIQKQGPYNIIGETWGGATALTVGLLLEALGHQVNLILIQGVPMETQNRIRALCKMYDADMSTCLLNVAFSSQPKEASPVGWDERLAQLLQTLEPDVQQPVSRALTSLNHQLTALLEFKLSSQLFKGDVTLIRNKTELLYDLDHLSMFCQKNPKIVTLEESNHCQLLSSFATATAINENIAFVWRP